MHCHLIIPKDNRRLDLIGKHNWIIGRSRESDIVIPDETMSRRHAMLQVMDNGEVYLVDLGSRNGSFVNGYRVAVPVKLNDRDQVKLGEAILEFRCDTSPVGEDAPSYSVAGTMAVQQRRLLSVLVVDVRDFTVLSRELGEQRLAEVMGKFFERAGAVIRAHSTRIEKFIGDALMAIWFHDDSGTGQEILQPLSAALKIHQATLGLNRDFILPFKLRIGAGINTGFAMVGITSAAGHADYTALGDTVNAAFRLENATRQLDCDMVIGQTTYHRLLQVTGQPLPFTPQQVRLKGYEGDIAAFSCSFEALDAFLKSRAR